ncbi:ribosome 60S biogenesis N-terminal-domain-containing protein [Lineolata rhizophorae]|uniref:Ribosome 60S biogenesis N-terminal-domain-containing protein n=1 Tax=Lineolata rhizophorae TaxID=578093 RepID=A0A6A6P5F4_9PEZI|nr:ribosome 60S biogenesis N-terminal-domain-containing protein [Lineolata rhizophorae]
MPPKRACDAPLDRPDKRPRLEAETITSSSQLKLILNFDETALERLRNGLHSFKVFLDSILYSSQDNAILKEYLEKEKPTATAESDDAYLADLILTLKYASEKSVGYLFSSVVADLALLLRAIGANFDLLQYGRLLCATILSPENVKLIGRGLANQRVDPRIISPCLRLLTEIVSFDGGAFAEQVYRRKEDTYNFQVLSRNLKQGHFPTGPLDEARQGPTIRSNAVRYLLASLKFQGSSQRIEILKQGKVLGVLFGMLPSDPPELAHEIISELDKIVANNPKVPQSMKEFVFFEKNLQHILELGRKPRTRPPRDKELRKLAMDVVFEHCTTEGLSLLKSPSSWYPPNYEDRVMNPFFGPDNAVINLGLDNIPGISYDGKIPVRNSTLASFIRHLRPNGRENNQQLLLAIFKNCPELVAHYFLECNEFEYAPRHSMVYASYATFITSIVELPMPPHFGKESDYSAVPPPAEIVIENIIPRSLKKDVFTRCLNLPEEKYNDFAIQVLKAVLTKSRDIFLIFDKVGPSRPDPSLWRQASQRLMSKVTQRIPHLKDVITYFRRLDREKDVKRVDAEAVLSLYYEAVPDLAFSVKFDISRPMTEALTNVEVFFPHKIDNYYRKELCIQELHNLVNIALRDPDIDWWRCQKGMKLSPFVSLLRAVVFSYTDEKAVGIGNLLGPIVEEIPIVQLDTAPHSSIDALVRSLKPLDTWSPSEAVFRFLSTCCMRCATQPVKYQDLAQRTMKELYEYSYMEKEGGPGSMLLMTIHEQWMYILNKAIPPTKKEDFKVPEPIPHRREGRRDHVGVLAEVRAINWNEDARYEREKEKTIRNAKEALKGMQEDFGIASADDLRHITKWVGRFLRLAKLAGEDESFVEYIFTKLRSWCRAHQAIIPGLEKAILPTFFDKNLDFDSEELITDSPQKSKSRSPPAKSSTPPGAKLDEFMSKPIPTESDDHSGLLRWARKDLVDAIEDGAVGELVVCSCSAHLAIRKEAMTQTKQLIERGDKIGSEKYPEWEMISLILRVVLEKVRELGDGTPLSYFDGAFVERALRILADPNHYLYRKMCAFIMRGPTWKTDRLAGYWTNRVLSDLPDPPADNPDGWRRGFEWLLDWFVDGLRGGDNPSAVLPWWVIEKILVMNDFISVTERLRYKILQLLFRVAAVGDGAEYLIKRLGILAWLKIRAQVESVAMYRQLGRLAKLLTVKAQGGSVEEWAPGYLEGQAWRMGMKVLPEL